MFLATTARTDFWDVSSQPILFLGEWCLRRDRPQDWQHLERRVLPSPWDDRAALHEAAKRLDELGERVLSFLCEFLNSLHGIQRDIRYWRILAGPWLMHALHSYYDRWVCIQKALEQYPDLTTIVVDPADYTLTRYAAEWVYFSMLDEFNLQLYSEVFETLGCKFPSRRLYKPEAKSPVSAYGRFRDAALTTVTRVSVAAARRLRDTTLVHGYAYLGVRGLVSLMLQSGLRVWPFEPVDERSVVGEPAEPRRAELLRFPSGNSFERFFAGRLRRALPITIVERYRAKVKRSYFVAPSTALVTFGGWYSEDFPFTAAEASARRARLIGVQHGSGYGMHQLQPPECFERRVSDTFLAWGWGNNRYGQSIRNVPAGSLRRFRKVQLSPRASDVLFIATAHPRYLYRFQSSPVAGQFERYYAWQHRFLRALPSKLRPHFVFRGNPNFSGFGEAQCERLAEFEWLRWDRSPQLSDSLRNTRLVVTDHPGTSMLQVGVTNVPYVLFWDPDLWEFRDEARSVFDGLRKAGILFDDPEAAASVIAGIHEEPDTWWQSRETARARSQLNTTFASYSDDWPRIWAAVFRDIQSDQAGRDKNEP